MDNRIELAGLVNEVIERRDAELHEVSALIDRSCQKSYSNDEIIRYLSKKKSLLWMGSWAADSYQSQSEADLALCSHLSYWTGNDQERVDRLFRQSGLMRKKWDEVHFSDGSTYGQATITKSYSERTVKKRERTRSSEQHQTDLGNARKLVEQFGYKMKYCHPWKKWLVWDEKRWRVDDTGAVLRIAKDTLSIIFREAGQIQDEESRRTAVRHALASERSERINAMLKLAQSEPGIPILPKEMDANPYLLNVQNGTIDLKKRELRPHGREDLITKVVPIEYDKEAKCPRWDRFLDQILAKKKELKDYLKCVIGYCLTGDASLHDLYFLHGEGANGKSVFLSIVSALLGPYACRAMADILMSSKYDRHSTEVAALAGSRIAICSEVEVGRKWSVQRIKELTGETEITARRMREDPWTFQKTFKIVIAGNHKPIVDDTTHSFWRRLKLIPFTVTIPKGEQNPKLIEKLKLELPGILNWAIDGLRLFLENGLQTPEIVSKAVNSYQDESDHMGEFISEVCSTGEGYKVQSSVLYNKYSKWTEGNDGTKLSIKRFKKQLIRRGFSFKHTNVGNIYQGLKIRPPGQQSFQGIEKENTKPSTHIN